MPEGHTLHRLANRHNRLLRGQRVAVSSPQGRFEDGAALLDGMVLRRASAYGKHLFHEYVPPADSLGAGERGSGRLLHVHLGLYGKFTEGHVPAPPPRGAVRMRLVGEESWLDLRGPINCEVVTPGERRAILARLGPDPLARRPDPEPYLDRLDRSRAPVAGLLMDQAVLAGVGNVYRAEVLFRHRVPPMRPGREVGRAAAMAMWEDLVVLMRAGVSSGRIITTEPRDRSRPTGRVRREDASYVYRRTGLPCRLCDTPVAHAELQGRNLFWCPSCQAG